MVNGYASQMSSSDNEEIEHNGALISLKKSKDNDEWIPNSYKTKKKPDATVDGAEAQELIGELSA